MDYFTKRIVPAKPRIIACRLDSKSRLVLPLVIREKLSVSKGDLVLFEILFSDRSETVLKIFKASDNSLKKLNKYSRNSWENGEVTEK